MKPKLILLLIVLVSGTLFSKAEAQSWYKGNMHTHSYWSDGNTFPEEVARWYSDHGYHFLAVTDHNLLQTGRKTRVIGKDTVVLKTFTDYCGEFDKPGKFLLIHSEEVSDASEKKPVHLNAFNTYEVIKPTGGPTVGECLKSNVEAIKKGLSMGRNPEWLSVNHPNFGWGITYEELARCGARLFEVYNGHPSVRNYGDSVHMSTETMWDYANHWRVGNGQPVLLGTATDDAHQYDVWGVGKANPGRGWVMVRAKKLTPSGLAEAMLKGDFYSSTGVTLKALKSGKKRIQLEILPEEGVTYQTEFIGWIDGKKNPEVLKTVSGNRASYRMNGNEQFVRARITSSKPKANPYAAGDTEMAWTQPVAR